MPRTSVGLPVGYRDERRGRVRLVAVEELFAPLVDAGALSGDPPEEWGAVELEVGGGRAPLLGLRVDGFPDLVLVKRRRRGGLLGRFLGGRTPVARVLHELALTAELRDAGIATPRILGVRLTLGSRPSVASSAETLIEPVEGGVDLPDWLMGKAPPLRSAVLRRAGEQVAALHRAGVIHEDLNLRNLLVGPDGEVHLLDLGGSRRVSATPARVAVNLARLYRSGVKWGFVPGTISRADVVRFLRGYAGDGWRDVHRAAASHYRRTLPLHRLGWVLTGHRVAR